MVSSMCQRMNVYTRHTQQWIRSYGSWCPHLPEAGVLGSLAWDTCWKELILHNEFSVCCHIEHPLGDWRDGGEYVKGFWTPFSHCLSVRGSTSCIMTSCKASVERRMEISTHLPDCSVSTGRRVRYGGGMRCRARKAFKKMQHLIFQQIVACFQQRGQWHF